MNVKLISKTCPISELWDQLDVNNNSDEQLNITEQLISYCARVSNPKNQTNFKTSSKLLKYCMDHSHWSIFEMVDLTFEFETTRDIGRQILRHRTMNFEEFSQRYAEVDTSTMVVREARLQDNKNRQNSNELPEDKKHLQEEWELWQKRIYEFASRGYQWALDNGLAKECARVVLPEGNTKTIMYAKAPLRTWIHWVELREGNGTQKEHSILAKKVKSILMNEFNFLRENWKNDSV